MMLRHILVPAALCGALAAPATAQDAAGIDTLMDLCIPISATGTSVRAGLRDAGWAELGKPDAAAPLGHLVASQMWFMEADGSPERRLALAQDYSDAFYASLGNDMLGPVYVLGDEVAMVLVSDDNISCIWAGPEDAAVKARIDAVGSFPAAEGTVTAARTQLVEAGGSDYRRIETYAFIDETERAGPLPYAARLDRSPVQ